MKVVEGNFSNKDEQEVSLTLLASITEALEQIEATEVTEGQFFLVLNTPQTFSFISNRTDLAELLALLEVTKGSVLEQYMETL